jgi:hypothetical protein
MTNQRQIEERSFDRSQALRQFVVLRGDRLKIYEHEREVTDSEDYDRNEQQFIIGRKDGIIELNEKKLTFTLQL